MTKKEKEITHKVVSEANLERGSTYDELLPVLYDTTTKL